MKNLNDKEIEFITQIINNSKIKSNEMKEDLIDHFCCAIEDYMNKGLSFKESYDKAYHNICPNGFDEIQSETIYLLTFKKVKAMKKLLYFSGYLSAIGVTTTLVLKLNHLPGGSPALFFTMIIVVLLFLPTLFTYLYRNSLNKSSSEKLKYIFGFLGTALLISGFSFRLFHWPGAYLILIISVIIINFAFFPFIFFKMYKKSV